MNSYISFTPQIDWNLLNTTVTRYRENSILTVASNGQPIPNFVTSDTPPQVITCQLRSHTTKSGRSIIHGLPEGVSQRITFILLCNYLANDVPNSVSTDIQFMDRIKDSSGTSYRVEAVLDDSGVGSHIIAFLSTLAPSTIGDNA